MINRLLLTSVPIKHSIFIEESEVAGAVHDALTSLG